MALVMRASGDWEELARELERCRRYERTFGLVRVEPSPDTADRAALLAGIRRLSRRIDSVWPNGGAVLVLLPETDRDAAEWFVARLLESSPGLTGAEVSIASFPTDGVTSRALLEALDRSGRDQEHSLATDLGRRATRLGPRPIRPETAAEQSR